MSGCCDLNGLHKVKRFDFEKYRSLQRRHIYNKGDQGLRAQEDGYDESEEWYRIPAVTLRQGSWFGDYHILTSIKSNFELRASKAAKSHSGSTGRIGKNKVQIFQLNAEKFKEIVNHYPDFRRFLLLRANLRRTHWLKVYEENRHQWLTKKKIEE